MATRVRVGGVNAVKITSTSRAEAGGTLRSLTDTDVSNLGQDYLLVYNSALGVWISQAKLGDTTDIDGGAF